MPVIRKPEDHAAIIEKKKAQFASAANSDAIESIDDIGKLEKKTIRIHPDVLHAVWQLARAERKTFAEALRGVILIGLQAKGIEI